MSRAPFISPLYLRKHGEWHLSDCQNISFQSSPFFTTSVYCLPQGYLAFKRNINSDNPIFTFSIVGWIWLDSVENTTILSILDDKENAKITMSYQNNQIGYNTNNNINTTLNYGTSRFNTQQWIHFGLTYYHFAAPGVTDLSGITTLYLQGKHETNYSYSKFSFMIDKIILGGITNSLGTGKFANVSIFYRVLDNQDINQLYLQNIQKISQYSYAIPTIELTPSQYNTIQWWTDPSEKHTLNLYRDQKTIKTIARFYTRNSRDYSS